MNTPLETLSTPDLVLRSLADVGYLADSQVATSVWLASRLERPLLTEGEPGVGKTALAQALALMLGTDLVRLQCHEGIDHEQAVAAWDHARQLLHVRALEVSGEATPAATMHDVLHQREFLLERPLLTAISRSKPGRPAVLLIDEIDRADEEFEAFLLEFLDEWSVTIPEIGTIRAEAAPLVILTSNRTRDLHDALRRRCLYQWFDHPSSERTHHIVELRHPELNSDLGLAVVAASTRLRELCRRKPPGLSEILDWVAALRHLGVVELDEAAWEATRSTVLKDVDDVRTIDLEQLLPVLPEDGMNSSE